MNWTVAKTNTEIRVLPHLDALSRAAAGCFVEAFRRAATEKHCFTVALAGGSTPKSLYRLLAEERAPFRAAVDWPKVNFFWGDERCVPPDSADSNYRTAEESLLRPLGISPLSCHRIEGELDAEESARQYEQVLRLFFNLPGVDGVPRFDLVLLGMGADGHTASIFPGTAAVRETQRFVAAPFVEKLGARRVTLTPPVVNNAAHVVFMIAGEDKAETLREVLEGAFEPERLPSQIVRPTAGRLTWLVDEAAARRLSRDTLKRFSDYGF